MTDDTIVSTANLFDAALALGTAYQLITSLRALEPGWRLEGPARCVRHFGSVDIFLEAIDRSAPGEVLIIDNDGLDNEGCIGDLIVIEASAAGLAGIVVWGRNRDSMDLRRIGLSVFSRGSCAAGPTRLDQRSAVAFGEARLDTALVRDGDWITADEDGLLVLSGADYSAVRQRALEIRKKEAAQADAVRRGTSLREQFNLDEFKRARERDPKLTFRHHLSRKGGAIEV
jgi:regulator of RNase E activity RraA